MSATKVYTRMTAAGLALLPLLAAAPAALADESLGGFSTWTGESDYTGPGAPGKPGKKDYLQAVCVDPSYSGHGKKRHRQYTVTSIEEAMHAVAPGGVIEVKPGAVADDLVIYKPVELRAGDCYRRHAPPRKRGWDHYLKPSYTHLKDMLRPALVSKAGRPCISVHTRGRVIVSGFRLGAMEHGKGACVYQARGEVLMSDNVLHGARGGTSVYVRNGALWLIGNTLREGKVGVDLSSRYAGNREAGMFVHRNRFQGMRTGILVRTEVPVQISENQIANTVIAGVRRLSGHADIRSNIFSDNSGNALTLEGRNRVHISDNKFVFNRTAVSSETFDLHIDNFRFNHVACNQNSGVYDIATNSIAHNPVKRGGWFSRDENEEAMRYCSELVHSPVQLGDVTNQTYPSSSVEPNGIEDDGRSRRGDFNGPSNRRRY
ncbi:MAG: right-handed parallel beta-helix repeat-containing protein [Alphaproteobacteria bacterium]